MTLISTPAGITMSDSVMNLDRGWLVVYDDGTVVTENEIDWKRVKKGRIRQLAIKWRNKFWSVSGKTAYIQFKRGSVGISMGGRDDDIRCEEHCIGYYEKDGSKVIYRVNHVTGKMRPQVIESSVP